MVYDRTTAHQEWKSLPLGEAVDILDSRRIPVNSDERAKRVGDVPYYGATGQVGWIDDYIFDEELVLLGEDGAPFLDRARPKAYMIRGKAWVNNHAHVLRGKAGILLNSFLLHQLNRVDYTPYVSGTTRLKLPQAPLRRIQVLVPPLDEQQRIVAEIEKQFTRMDAGTTSLTRVQSALKRYRASVLKAACEGRLVPTEADLACKENRSYETGEQLLQRILKERRENWSGKGKYKEPTAPEPPSDADLPQGWIWTGVEQLADGTKHAIKAGPFGSSLKKSMYTRTGFKIFGQEQVIRGDPYFGGYFISHELFTQLKACEAKPGDILISLVGTAGKVLILPADSAPGIINPRLLKLSLSRFGVNPKFIKILLESSTARMFFKLAAHGGTMEILNLGILKALPVPLPPMAEQTRIVADVERRLSVLEELETVLNVNFQRATRLRQSILTTAFAAQRPDAESSSRTYASRDAELKPANA
jgi:type I restriction enzyme S subunit